STRARVDSATSPLPFRAFEAVAIDTPARAATSLSVTALVVVLSLMRLLLKGYRADRLTSRRSSRYTLSKGFSFSFGEPGATQGRAKESTCTSHDTAPCSARQPPPWLRECWRAASPPARPRTTAAQIGRASC